MAKQLWFLRHGEAEPHGTRPDPERRLTVRGEDQARTAGRALARLGLSFHAVLTSPRVRALDTARLACEALGVEPCVHPPLSADFDAAQARELLLTITADEALLLVGHEPDFSQTVHDLTGARIGLEKGGMAAVRARSGAAELLALMRSRELGLVSG